MFSRVSRVGGVGGVGVVGCIRDDWCVFFTVVLGYDVVMLGCWDGMLCWVTVLKIFW